MVYYYALEGLSFVLSPLLFSFLYLAYPPGERYARVISSALISSQQKLKES
jgi:hypothetical protein